MPPRYAYWTIIAGGLPTAFRAAEREDLLPTFQRIKDKHPDAEMKWFARGKLWASPEEARSSQDRGGRNQRDGRRPFKPREGSQEGRQKRDRNWRPGGEHRDPRQKFIDAKKDRNARIRKERWEHKNTASTRPTGPAASTRPTGPAASTRPTGPAASTRPTSPAASTRPASPARKPWQKKPWEQKKPWDAQKPSPRSESKPWQRDEKKPWPRDTKRPWQRDASKPWQRDKPDRRAQDTGEPRPPKRPPGPNREPKPSENPKPTRPPQPDEPITPSPGPPEQGRSRPRPFRSQKRFSRGPRRG